MNNQINVYWAVDWIYKQCIYIPRLFWLHSCCTGRKRLPYWLKTENSEIMKRRGLKHRSFVVYKDHISSVCWRVQLDEGLDGLSTGSWVACHACLVSRLSNCGETCIYGHLWLKQKSTLTKQIYPETRTRGTADSVWSIFWIQALRESSAS